MSICTTTIGAETLSPIEFYLHQKASGLTCVVSSGFPVVLIFFHDHTVCITITMYSVTMYSDQSGRLIDLFSNFFLATTVSFNLRFLSWSHCVACGILVPRPESKTYARNGVLTTGPPEMSHYYSLFAFPKILE